MHEKPQTLQKVLYRSYLTSALIPILIVETILLVLYFGINAYISGKTNNLMLKEAALHLHEINQREANNISRQLKEVSRSALLLQNEHQLFFENPGIYPLPSGSPSFEVHTNGAYYKTTKNGSSLYYSSTTEIGPEQQLKAVQSEYLDTSFQSIVKNNPSIVAAYLNTWDGMNRLYPYIENTPEQYGPALTMEDHHFYYLADSHHNPERKPVWTEAYLDPAGRGWMISCIVPVYKGDFLEGVAGLDVTIDVIMNHILRLNLPWNVNAFMVDQEGKVLAMPEGAEEILEFKELKHHIYTESTQSAATKPDASNLLAHPNSDIAAQFDAILKSDTNDHTLTVQNQPFLVNRAQIGETGWNLMSIVRQETIFAPVDSLRNLSLQIGYAAIFFMLVFSVMVFVYLLRKSSRVSNQIAAPIIRLAEMNTSDLQQMQKPENTSVKITEIERLNENFFTLCTKLKEQSDELLETKIRESVREKETEIAFSQGLYESASSYLHNIGNSLSGIDGKLLQLKQALDSTDNYPLVFKSIRNAHNTKIEQPEKEDETPQLLERFEILLVHKLIPQIYGQFVAIKRIRDQIYNSIKHQQDSFRALYDPHQKYVQEFNVSELIKATLEDYESRLQNAGITLKTDIGSDLYVKNQKNQFTHGVMNLLNNAIDAIVLNPDSSKEIHILLKSSESVSGIVLRMTDTGTGIDPKDAKKMLRAGFTTKEHGHGLGLHSFVNFLNANKGSLTFESAGIGQGATFTVILEDIS